MSEEKKNEILINDLDTDELEAVSGGFKKKKNPREPELSTGYKGNCRSSFYEQRCKATVEFGSSCWKNDGCITFSSYYSCVPKSNRKELIDGMSNQEADMIAQEVPDSCEGGADELL